MKDFKDFEEVKSWILDIDEMNGVFVGNLYFSHNYMSCGEGCCDDSFADVDATIDYIQKTANNDISKVERY